MFPRGLSDIFCTSSDIFCTSSTDYVVLTKTPLTLKENSPVGIGNHTQYDVEFVHFTSYLLSWLADWVMYDITLLILIRFFSEGLKEGSERRVREGSERRVWKPGHLCCLLLSVTIRIIRGPTWHWQTTPNMTLSDVWHHLTYTLF